MLWRIGVPSFWRDEGATLSAAHRSFPQLIRMLGHMDAVHGTYYLLIWLLVRVAGSGELALRLPSAVAMAAAAGLLTALGRRLAGPAAGLAAGLSFAADTRGQLVRPGRPAVRAGNRRRHRRQLLLRPLPR